MQVQIMTADELEELIERAINKFIQKNNHSEHTPQVELISPEELCKRMNISIPTQIRLRKKGKLPFIEAGNQIRYDWNKVLLSLQTENKYVPSKQELLKLAQDEIKRQRKIAQDIRKFELLNSTSHAEAVLMRQSKGFLEKSDIPSELAELKLLELQIKRQLNK